jgi:tRNA pseudouridine38-40 synthase
MPRYRIVIEYDGKQYCGWQTQAEGGSVQDAINDAIYGLSGERSRAFGAGRTDAGVHARGQVAHIDLEKDFSEYQIRAGLNFHLKAHSICVLEADIVDEEFDARFSATRRHYIYKIISRPSPLTIDAAHNWWVPQALDIASMQSASKYFIGQHDFTSFRSSECQSRSPVKTLDAMDVTLEDGVICVRTHARSFLHNQVRSMVGALKYVGSGKWEPEKVAEVLQAKDRRQCAPVAPACGLYLMQVDYPAPY